MTTYCQSSPLTANAGEQLTDRSAYLPWTANFFSQPTTNGSYPSAPAQWANVANQAVFATQQGSLFGDSTNSIALDNGYGTWFANVNPVDLGVVYPNTLPTASSLPWLIPSAPEFISNTWPSCNGNSVTTLPGYTAICVDGSAPVCSNNTMTCSSDSKDPDPVGWGTNNPIFLNNKYLEAYQGGFFQYTPNGSIAYDLVDCNGAHCACTGSDGKPIQNAAPIAISNQQQPEGIFSFPTLQCTQGTLSSAQPTFRATVNQGYLVPQTTQPTCPVNTNPSCASTSLTSTVTMGDPLYPVCQFNTAEGTYEMTPMCENTQDSNCQTVCEWCNDGIQKYCSYCQSCSQSVPTWSSSANEFYCNGKAVSCPSNALSTTPLIVTSSQCSDGSAPACVYQPWCSTFSEPSLPAGFQLKSIYQNSQWQTVGYNPSTGQTVTAPTCDFFGMKQTDLCACNCIVDTTGAPIAEAPAVIMSDGSIGCKDPFTKMNCFYPAVIPSCVDQNGNTTGTVPTCKDSTQPFGIVRAVFDATNPNYDPTNTATGVVCPANATGPPTCSNNLTVAATGIVCTDIFPGTNYPSLNPVVCYSEVAGGACETFQAYAPVINPVDGTLVCDQGTMFCPYESGSYQPITSKTICANNQPPMCIPNQGVCTDVFNLPEFGSQAIVPPTDDKMVSNYGIAFCSSQANASNSCNTIMQSYFPMLDGPPGSGIQGIQSGQANPYPFLLPDMATAGGLAQGICMSGNKTISNYSTGFACALPSNPPTVLTNWNEAGYGNTSVVTVGLPQALNQVNGAYPSEIYFYNQAGTGPYDHGLIYYLSQTGTVDASGAEQPSIIGGYVAAPQGTSLHCPREDDVVRPVYPEGKFERFQARCVKSGVRPIAAAQRPMFPEQGTCPETHILGCLDLVDTPFADENGLMRCSKTDTPAVCLPKASRDKDHHTVEAYGETVSDPLKDGTVSTPNEPCVNQVVNPADPRIQFMGQGAVGRLFEYDPVRRACAQKQICEGGTCATNFASDSFIDYHQGIWMSQWPSQPIIFYSETTFPPSMFGDLGYPGVGQRLNPTLINIQPMPEPKATDTQSQYQVPAGFLYWPQNSDTTLYGATQRTAAYVIKNSWYIFEDDASVAETVNSTFDATGAGVNPATQKLSTGQQSDVYETWFSPSVVGAPMSGVMAAQTAAQVAQGIDRTQNVPIMSVPWTNMNVTTGNNTGYNFPGYNVQVQPYRYTYWGYDYNLILHLITKDPSSVRGFNRCDMCGFFYCYSSEGNSGTCPSVGSIPAMTLGNLPGDVDQNSSDACKSMLGNVTFYFTETFANSCVAPNADNCVGMSASGCEANLYCKCTCGGTDKYFTRYTFTADDYDTCGTFCTPNYCAENVCGSDPVTNAVCVNSDQIPA